MKKGLDPNKIFAVILMATLVAAFSGFLSRELVEPEFPEKKGYAVAVTDAPAAGEAAAAPKEAEPIDELMKTADAAAGEKVSKACAACHSFDSSGGNRVGPGLFGVVGRAVASHGGFGYSDALKAKGGSWSVAELNKWLFNPKADVPGTKMVFSGLSKPQDRANLISYLSTLK
jgi:cytochrome c